MASVDEYSATAAVLNGTDGSDTTDSLDFEILPNSPSCTSENILELVNTFADENVREEIINNVQMMINDNRRLKESLVETNKEMAEQYEKLKTWVTDKEFEDKRKENAHEKVVNDLEDMRVKQHELESHIAELSNVNARLNTDLEKAANQTRNLEKEKAELIAMNVELRSQGLHSIDIQASGFSVVERTGSLEAASEPAGEVKQSNINNQDSQTSLERDDTLQDRISQLTHELHVQTEKLEAVTLKCHESEAELAIARQELDRVHQAAATTPVTSLPDVNGEMNKMCAEDEVAALNQEIINLQKKCTEWEHRYRELECSQLAELHSRVNDAGSGGGAGDGAVAAHVEVEYLKGVLMQRDEALGTKDSQIQKLQDDVKKVVAEKSEYLEHVKTQEKAWQDDLLSVVKERDRYKKELEEEAASKAVYYSAYHNVESRLRALGVDRQDGEDFLFLPPTTEEQFPPRGGVDEVDEAATPHAVAASGVQEQEPDAGCPGPQQQQQQQFVPAAAEFVCPVCGRQWETLQSLQGHAWDCVDDTERQQRREQHIEA